MSKPAQRGRKPKAALPLSLEPAPIVLQQESASDALHRDSDSEDAVGGAEEAKDGGSDNTAMPQPDMFFDTQALHGDATSATAAASGAGGTSSEMSMLTHQLQLMQQIIMMQQQQMQQQLQQHKAELDETKKLFIAGAPAAASADVASAAPSSEPASFTSFRTTVPELPLQTGNSSGSEINTLRGRIGMANDSIVAPSSRQDYSHVTEFQLGSRYVIKGLGLM